MKGLVKTIHIARVLGTSRKAVLERAGREGWPCARNGGGLLWVENRLPVDIRLALVNVPQSPAAEVLTGGGYTKATEKERTAAVYRGSLIAAWKRSGLRKDDFIAAYNAGSVSAHLYNVLGAVSPRTFYRWEALGRTQGADGLLPRYSAASGGAGESLSDTEKALLERFWLKDSRPAISHAFRLLKENYPASPCTYQTARRYLSSLPKPVVDFYRLGPTAFANRHQPFIDQNIWQYKSLDVVVSDHHCLDCVAMYQGKLVRPWVTTMQDFRSGKILGWCPSVAPSSLSIIAAYYMAVIQYGIPRRLLFDNGRDYRSELLNGKHAAAKVYTPETFGEEKEIYIQGLFYIIGSEVSFTRVYSGKSKGRQERYYQLIKEYVAKEAGGYIGGDTTERPEASELYFRSINGKAKRNDVPGWDDVVNALAVMIPYINDEFTSGGKGMEGKTASRVFDENLPADVRRADRDTLRVALSKGEPRTVKNNVVEIRGVPYYHPDLFTWSGRQVIVRHSLITDSEVMICDLDGRFICDARADYFFEGGDLSAATRRAEGAKKLNLMKLAERGTGEAAAAPEYETMIEVARNKYRQAVPIDLDEYLALPQAAGAETVTQPGRPGRDKPQRVLTNPLEAKPEDYL
jgi:hypothetical protein